MIKIWYNFMKHYIKLGFFFYYKKIKHYGKENIPKKGAILFVSNHPNALIDPLLIKTGLYKDLHVLTRASVFTNKFVIKIFESVKMIPIYRKRDGLSAWESSRLTGNGSLQIMLASSSPQSGA